jgi:hypothetical protein
MRLDIRLPLGLLFMVVGVLLSGFGLTSDPAIYERSLHINVNLWWGVALFAFGLFMYALGHRGHRRLAASNESSGDASQGSDLRSH